jgi:hypothetical protein
MTQRPLQGVLENWWSPTTFTSCRPIPWATPKGLSPLPKNGCSLSKTVCCMARLVCQRNPPQATSAASLYVCTSLQTFYTLLRMPNGKPKLGGSWISLSKLVSRQESHTSTRGCTLMLNHKIRTNQTTTSQCGGSSNPFSMFKHIILIIPHHLVILDSFVALIQQLERSD